MNEKDKYLKTLLDNLNHDDYMNLCYNTVMSFSSEVLLYDDVSAERRIEGLSALISYFSEKEEYEKCNSIKKVQDLLKNIKNNIC
jgi:hypothetical protein